MDLERIRALAGVNKNKGPTDTKVLNEANNSVRAPQGDLSKIAQKHGNSTKKDDSELQNISYHNLMAALKEAWKLGYKAGMETNNKKGKVNEGDESSKEATEGGHDYDPKGGEPTYKKGKHQKVADDKTLSKKAQANEGILRLCHLAGLEESARFDKGSVVRYNGKKYVVNVSNAKADFVGLVPVGMKNATESEKDRATDLVRAHKLSLYSEDQEEVTDMDTETDEMDTADATGVGEEPAAVDYDGPDDEYGMAGEDDAKAGEELEMGAVDDLEDATGDLQDVAGELEDIAARLRNANAEEEPEAGPEEAPEEELGAEQEIGAEEPGAEEEMGMEEPDEEERRFGESYSTFQHHKTEDKGPAYHSGGSGYGPKPPNTFKTVAKKPGEGGEHIFRGKTPQFDAHPNASWLRKSEISDVFRAVVHKDDSEGYDYTDVKSNAKSDLKRIGNEKQKGTKGGNSIIGEAEDGTVWDKDYHPRGIDGRLDAEESRDNSVHSPDLDNAVKVPANIKQSLQEEINTLRRDAEKVRSRDYLQYEFYDNTAAALENLLGYLNEGTKRSLMLAQIDMNRIMSPMQHRIPNDVYLYIVRGGKPSSLTDLFKEVKTKGQDGADLSKEDYIK